jgi:hypothetical protein
MRSASSSCREAHSHGNTPVKLQGSSGSCGGEGGWGGTVRQSARRQGEVMRSASSSCREAHSHGSTPVKLQDSMQDCSSARDE